jgi:hypothetical protein
LGQNGTGSGSEGRFSTSSSARTIYAGSGDNAQFGFRFVRLIDPTENTSRDKALWRYLLEEQRGQIRKMKLLR